MISDNKKINNKKDELISNSKNIWLIVRDFFYDTLNITEGTDINGTIEGIKRDIIFKGHSVWILIASIFIASIGLNQNSIPVIIGAMLISPLMGPIIGIGYSVGTNDWETLKKSLKYFLVAVIISILTSTIYFFFSPLKEAQSELFARTQPTLLDVFIGIFGGLAGIVAGSRREKSNVIPGVAIATALMPPLCTAGYGLATSQMTFFIGGFYLFFINSIFISVSTFVVVRYLHFPLQNFVSKHREKRIKLYMTIFILIVIIPSGGIFWNVVQESRFHYRTNQFITENFGDYKQNIIYKNIVYNDTLSEITIYLTERKFSDAQILDLKDKLNEYGLGGNTKVGINVTDSTNLIINQEENSLDSLAYKVDNIGSELSKSLRVGILEDIYKKQEVIITGKNDRISFLENQLINIKKDSLPLTKFRKELTIQYPKLEVFSFSKAIETDFATGKMDTIHIFLVKWKRYTKSYLMKKNELELEQWLKVRFDMDTLKIVRYN